MKYIPHILLFIRFCCNLTLFRIKAIFFYVEVMQISFYVNLYDYIRTMEFTSTNAGKL